MDIKKLNKLCLREVAKYSRLNIYGTNIPTPYYINHFQTTFSDSMKRAGLPKKKSIKAWEDFARDDYMMARFRGKGTPEQLEAAVIDVSSRAGLPLQNASNGVILNFMKLYGLGVDCSGYVFNVLNSALENKLINELAIPKNSKQDIYNASASTFAGRTSFLVEPKSLQQLDLIFIKTKSGKYNHIALVVLKNNHLCTAQSTIGLDPSGVRTDNLSIKNNAPNFNYKPEIGTSWEELYKTGRLEFRRLNLLK
jgi:hypothetical protein